MLGSDKVMSSCTNLDNNFLNINSFSYVSGICQGGWWILGAIVVNFFLSGASIYCGQQRFRYERQVQFILKRKSEEWYESFQSYIFWLSLHQLFLVLNFVFLVNTNIFQLLFSAILNVGFRVFYYNNNLIGSDNEKLGKRYDLVRQDENKI